MGGGRESVISLFWITWGGGVYRDPQKWLWVDAQHKVDIWERAKAKNCATCHPEWNTRTNLYVLSRQRSALLSTPSKVGAYIMARNFRRPSAVKAQISRWDRRVLTSPKDVNVSLRSFTAPRFFFSLSMETCDQQIYTGPRHDLIGAWSETLRHAGSQVTF